MSKKYLKSIVGIQGDTSSWTKNQRRQVYVAGKLLAEGVENVMSVNAQTALQGVVSVRTCLDTLAVLREDYLAQTFHQVITNRSDLLPLIGEDTAPVYGNVRAVPSGFYKFGGKNLDQIQDGKASEDFDSSYQIPSPRRFVVVLSETGENDATGDLVSGWWVTKATIQSDDVKRVMRGLNRFHDVWVLPTDAPKHGLYLIQFGTQLIEPIANWIDQHQNKSNQYQFVLAKQSVWE